MTQDDVLDDATTTRRNVRDDILDAIHRLLTLKEEPVHFNVLFGALVHRELTVPGAAEENKVYGYVYHDMRKHGEQSRFRKVGRAMFTTAALFNPDKYTPTPPGSRPQSDGARKRKEREERQLAAHNCGGCTYIEFAGIQELHQIQGTCGAFDRSGRLSVGRCEESCVHWQPRSDAKQQSDHVRYLELYGLVVAVNHYAQRGQTWNMKDMLKQKEGRHGR